MNDDVNLNTNVIEEFDQFAGVVEVDEDDWYITSDNLDDNQSFAGTIPLNLEGFINQESILVEVTIVNANDVELDQLLVPMIGEEIIPLPEYRWDGNVHHAKGYWLPPVSDDFLLQRKAAQIKFWVEDTSRSRISINFYEAEVDEEGNTIVGRLVKTIESNEITSKSCGKFSRLDESTANGIYYKYKVKPKDVNFLREGRSYILALMVGDSVIAFDDTHLATVKFTVAEGSLSKGGMKDTLGNSPKRLDSNRTLIKD